MNYLNNVTDSFRLRSSGAVCQSIYKATGVRYGLCPMIPVLGLFKLLTMNRTNLNSHHILYVSQYFGPDEFINENGT